MRNIYYNPEAFGLTTVAEVDFGESYEFDMIVVWKTLDGRERFYWAMDSGCSCPTPFENYSSAEELDVLNSNTWDSFESAVNSSGYRGGTAEKAEFIREVERAFRNGSKEA